MLCDGLRGELTCWDLDYTAYRLGFIKIAIQHGYVGCRTPPAWIPKLTRSRADLVPVFSFGENDVSLFARCRRGFAT